MSDGSIFNDCCDLCELVDGPKKEIEVCDTMTERCRVGKQSVRPPNLGSTR